MNIHIMSFVGCRWESKTHLLPLSVAKALQLNSLNKKHSLCRRYCCCCCFVSSSSVVTSRHFECTLHLQSKQNLNSICDLSSGTRASPDKTVHEWWRWRFRVSTRADRARRALENLVLRWEAPQDAVLPRRRRRQLHCRQVPCWSGLVSKQKIFVIAPGLYNHKDNVINNVYKLSRAKAWEFKRSNEWMWECIN